MGLHADAVELAKLTGKDVKECKRALKVAGNTIRKMTIVEKAMYLKFLLPPKKPAPPNPAPPKPTFKMTPPVEVKKALPPAPPAAKKPFAKRQLKEKPAPKPVAKAINPKPAKQVRKVRKVAKQVMETHDEEEMKGPIKDA